MVLNYTPTPSFIICGKKIFAHGERHVRRKFSRSVLILMLEGELRFLEDDELITLKPGEYYIQRHDLLQQGIPLTENLPVYFFFEFFGTYSEGTAGLPLRGTFDPKKVTSLTESCVNLFLGRNANAFRLNSYLLRILGELLEGAARIGENRPLAQNVRHFIDSQYTTPISLTDISKKLGYTEEYILRIFKKHYGMSPHQYLIGLRMEHAMWLLENTDISVEQTALSVGYTDSSAFYRSFKKTYGVSPSTMKKNKLE